MFRWANRILFLYSLRPNMVMHSSHGTEDVIASQGDGMISNVIAAVATGW